jgi:hypothetical protein
MSKFTRLKTVESLLYSTEVVFTHFLSGPFTTEAIMNLLDKKLANPTSVQCQFFFEYPLFFRLHIQESERVIWLQGHFAHPRL